jgi:hypothetical protein
MFDIARRLSGPMSLNGNAAVVNNSAIGPGISKLGGGSYLALDGSGDYALMTNQAPLNFNGSTTWTIEFWFYWNAFNAYSEVFSLNNGTGAGNRLVCVFIDNSDWFIAVDTSGGANGGSGNRFYNPQEWTQMVLVRNGTHVSGYVNGLLKGAGWTVGSAGGTTGGDLYLGINRTGGGTDFNGLMGPCSAWNYAKTDNEVWALYDPRTRWNRYLQQPSTRAYSFMSIAASAAGYLLVKN